MSDKISRPGAPAYLERLPEKVERSVPTWAEIGFHDLKYVHNDSCFGAHLRITSGGILEVGPSGPIGLFAIPHNDMSKALGLESNNSKLYFAWYGEYVGGTSTEHSHFSANVLGTLAEGKNLVEALNYAFKKNKEINPFESDPAEDYRILGQGNFDGFRIH